METKIITKIRGNEVELPSKKSTETFMDYKLRIEDIYYSYFNEGSAPSYNEADIWSTKIVVENYPDSEFAIEYRSYLDELKKADQEKKNKKPSVFKKFKNWCKVFKEDLKEEWEEEQKEEQERKEIKRQKRKALFKKTKNKVAGLFKQKPKNKQKELDKKIAKRKRKEKVKNYKNKFFAFFKRKKKEEIIDLDENDYKQIDDNTVVENIGVDYNKIEDEEIVENISEDYSKIDDDVIVETIQDEEALKKEELMNTLNQMLAEAENKAMEKERALQVALEMKEQELANLKETISAERKEAVEEYKKFRKERKEQLRQRHENPEKELTAEEIVNNPLVSNEYKKEVLNKIPTNTNQYFSKKTTNFSYEDKTGPVYIDLMNGSVQIKKDEFDMLVDSSYRLQKGVMVPSKPYTVHTSKKENEYYEQVLSEACITEIKTPLSKDASYMILPKTRYEELLTANEQYCNFVIHKKQLKELEKEREKKLKELELRLEQMKLDCENELEKCYNMQKEELVKEYGKLPKQKVMKK